jgi:hypothetical protein
MRPYLILICVVAALGAAQSTQAQSTLHCGTTLEKNVYRFCYDGTAWQVDEPSNVRFTSKDRVDVHVVHLNFFRYTLSFDVQEERSESYQYLSKLLNSVLGVGFGSLVGALGPPAGATDERAKQEQAFVNNVRVVVRYAEALDTKITRAIGLHRKPGLNDAEVSLLRDNLGTGTMPCAEPAWTSGEDPLIGGPVAPLSGCVTEKFNELERGVHTNTDQFAVAMNKYGEIYERAKRAYADVHARADQFQALATKTLGTETRKVGKRDAGVRITLTLTAVDASGGKSPIGDVSYVVESPMPLVVHGGLSLARLNDVTFEKVKRANQFSEDDVFQKKTDEANSQNFSMFMGWRLGGLGGLRPNTNWLSALISLGTDIDSPGKKVYVAPTIMLFNRFAFSYGAVLGKEQEGEQQTLEPDVFRIIKAKPSASQFFSISTRVF